jgi:3-phosphoshikimate 1-carboxyvinyltransferase
MNVFIEPKPLSGHVEVISSKSLSHRFVIAAGLAHGTSILHHVLDSDDLDATKAALAHFGVTFEGQRVSSNGFHYDFKPIDCHESGSTLRFMIPIAMLQDQEVTFTGKGRLPERPLTVYKDLFKDQLNYPEHRYLPCRIKGPLSNVDYFLRGDVSSQFFTGLLFALPCLNHDSTITWTTPLASKGYIDLTIDVLNQFGVHIIQNDHQFIIKGHQKYQPIEASVEGDYSQAAFWFAAGLLGEKLSLSNLIDLDDIPDLGPILMVLASFAQGVTHFTHISRLRIKESDRVEAMVEALTSCGVNVTTKDDELWIEGKSEVEGGITLQGHNDHRIVMALSIMSIKTKKGLTITDKEAVKKSYPHFFDVFQSLGGIVHESE